MLRSRRALMVGAYCNFAIALLHLVLGFGSAQLNRFFGAPGWFLRMLETQRAQAILLLIAMAAVFAVFALYALSGAGKIRHLPLLRTVLILVGVIYTLRGLEVPLDVIVIIRHSGAHSQFLVFSVVSLCVGLFYLLGVSWNWKVLKPTSGLA